MSRIDHALRDARWMAQGHMTSRQQNLQDVYVRGLFWILRERYGAAGGWPPRDVSKVSGWLSVRMLAHLTEKPVRQVAGELIDWSYKMRHGEEMP